MKLVICPSRAFAIYLLAFIEEFGKGEVFHLIISDSKILPTELIKLASKLNSKFVSQDEAQNEFYDDLIIHSYAMWSKESEIVSKFNFDTLIYFADGLRNGFYGLPSLSYKLRKLIYFGFILREKSFSLLRDRSYNELDTQVVSWHQLRTTWLQLIELSSVENMHEFTDIDIVLTMRYWSLDSALYRFKGHKTV